MASPFRKDQLSPAMVQRYGMDTRPWSTWLLAGGLVVGFLAVLVFIGTSLARTTGGNELLAWEVRSPEHVTVTFSVRRPDGGALECAVRGQDRSHVDVGYAVVEVPAGAPSTQHVAELRTLTTPYSIEVLGCARPGELNVIPPQFPPGVVPPPQPWTP